MKKTLASLGVLLALSCGGGRDPVLLLEPETPAVRVGETLPLSASPQVDLAGDVEWEVDEPYGGGLLQSQGLRVTYVPPGTAGTYHLVLRGQARSGRFKQVVAVRVLPSPVLEPAAPRVQPGAAVPFRVHMKGLPRDTATWAVEEPDGGEVGPEGRYLAPHRPGVYHVTATSAVDPDAVARATVTVAPD